MILIADENVVAFHQRTLSLSTSRALLVELLLIAAAIVFPALAHLADAPVRFLLPMQCSVILAGLIYCWRGGVLAGLVAPIASFLLSGSPSLSVLPSMTAELATYGFVTGIFREKVDGNPFLSVVIALVAGRAFFVVFVLITKRVTTNYMLCFTAALFPGLIAAAYQIFLLPLLARGWIKRQLRRTGPSSNAARQ
ncbi:MAG: ECF transporter S component [Ignavibacteria bacterium]|nr:ECF transporter S component [Ignavibacteria bacterium]